MAPKSFYSFAPFSSSSYDVFKQLHTKMRVYLQILIHFERFKIKWKTKIYCQFKMLL